MDTLSLLERLVRDKMLLGRPSLDDVSQVSLNRTRFSNAQSCRKTLSEPLKSVVIIMFPPRCSQRVRYAGLSFTRGNRVWFGAAAECANPPSVGAREECIDSALDTSVTGGGLHMS